MMATIDDYRQAFQTGNIKLVSDHFHINIYFQLNLNLYHFASLSKNVEAVDLLISLGDKSYDTPNAKGVTPLMMAVSENSVELIDRFIELGCDVSREDNNGSSLLHFVNGYRDGFIQVIEKVLQIYEASGIKNYVDLQNSFGFTALHSLILYIDSNRIIDVLTLILHHSSDPARAVALQDNHGYTIFTTLLSSECNNVDVIKLLYNYSKNIINIPSFYSSALHLAVKYTGYDDDISVVELLLELGCDTAEPDSYGFTPLRYAVLDENIFMVERLLEFDVEAMAHCNNGLTVYDEALKLFLRRNYRKTLKIIKILHAVYGYDEKYIKWFPKEVFDGSISTYVKNNKEYNVEKLKMVNMSDDKVLGIRYRIYFGRSLVSRLLLCTQKS
jgi:ankyrin repeat protein